LPCSKCDTTQTQSSLAKAGHGDVAAAPYFTHALVEFVMQSIPLPLLSKAIDYNLDMHVDIRKRALAKQKRTAAAAKK
jgi:hypothetical protein